MPRPERVQGTSLKIPIRFATGLVGLALLMFAVPLSVPGRPLPPHPRLIVCGSLGPPLSTDRLAELRSVVRPKGDPSTWSERKQVMVVAFRAIEASAHKWNADARVKEAWSHEPFAHQSEQFESIATLSLADLLLKTDPAYDRRYGRTALALLDSWREHKDFTWNDRLGSHDSPGG